jgi:hypothetical protein
MKQSQSQSQSQPQLRQRTASKTSSRPCQPSRQEAELMLIHGFPPPPTCIPTPPTTRTPPPSQPPAEVAPINDDRSMLYNNDPFRAKPIRNQDAAGDVASQSAPHVASSASFYIAHSRSSSPVPSSHVHPPLSLRPSEQQQQPPLSLLQLPFPDPSLSSSPQLSHSAMLSTSCRSAPTLLLTSDRDPPSKPVEAPSAEVEVAPPTPPLPHPCSEQPLPPLPHEAYQFVDPSTLTKLTLVSPTSGHRRSSLPYSLSWLSQNIHKLEVAVAKRLEASSVSSS